MNRLAALTQNNATDVPNAEDSTFGISVAITFALVAHRLNTYYEHDHWMTRGQAAILCSDWLQRKKVRLSVDQRTWLNAASDQIARQIKDSLSRDAGLFAAHELMESLGSRDVSEFGGSVMDECIRTLRSTAGA